MGHADGRGRTAAQMVKGALMSRIPAFPWKLLVTAVLAWALYLILGVAGWNSFSGDSVKGRFELDLIQMLLFGGWAALIVGLAGWMLSERDRERDGMRSGRDQDGAGTPRSDEPEDIVTT
jgi:hypothetical protein